MDKHELNKMFDQLIPEPARERELLNQLLREGARRKRPMKNWKRVILAAAAAALLVTGAAAAAMLPRINEKLLGYFNVEPENTEAVVEAVNLLYPGAMELDITKEDNGATLHATQILRDRDAIMILVDFTAPEGTSLYLGEPNTLERMAFKGFESADGAVAFLDAAGEKIGDGLAARCGWSILEDDDPLDNHVSMILTVCPQLGDPEFEKAMALQMSAANLSYYDWETQEIMLVYAGSWDFQVDLPQRDIGWTMQVDQVIGELDGATISAGELYLSPMTFELVMRREGGIQLFGVPTTDEIDAVYSRWMSIGNIINRITLTTKDGEVIPLENFGGGGIGEGEKILQHRLSQITDPAKFQGGTLTIEWDFTHNSEESGSWTISLDNLKPVEPAALAAD